MPCRLRAAGQRIRGTLVYVHSGGTGRFPFAANSFVRANATPGQSPNDVLLSTRHKSCLICILDTQQEIAAVLLGEQVV